MKNCELAIVIVAYNRAKPLFQLLASLNKIITDRDDIDLVISIDNKGTAEVIKIAEEFNWHYGIKNVKIHQKKLGLKKHFVWAGDQTNKYENILFLEDDLYVSPYVMDFVEAFLLMYENDDRIAGGSLYNPILCEFIKCKFYQYQDGFDNYFFQHPYWGNIWSRNKWNQFKKWLKCYEYKSTLLPSNVRLWGEQSFKKIYIQFLIECEKYIVYPRNSYVTNMGVKGLHNNFDAVQFQVVLENGKKNLRMSTFDESESIYDAFYEIIPEILKKHNHQLKKYNFCVDLLGIKDNIQEMYVLTSRPTRKAIFSFASSMRPAEQNVIANILGNGISLTNASDIIGNRKFTEKIRREKKCSIDIMNNYPVRAKHLAFATLFAIGKRDVNKKKDLCRK